jgi:hypothetical protein
MRQHPAIEQNTPPTVDATLPLLFDPQAVRTFVENLANQITDFTMQLAASMSQQMVNSIRDSQSGFIPPPFSLPSPAKRRKVSQGGQDSNLNSVWDVAGATSNPLLKTRLDRLKIGQKGHGHRGKTPGMPSLWSGDDSDDSRRKPGGKVTGLTAKKSRFVASAGSSLRNEVPSMPNEPGAAAPDEDISMSDDATLSAMSDDEHFIRPRAQHSGQGRLRMGMSPSPKQDSDVTHKKRTVLKRPRDEDDPSQPKRKYHKRRKKPFTTKDDEKMIELYYSGLGYKAIAIQFNATENQIRYHFTDRLTVAGANFQARPGIFTPPRSQSPSREDTEPTELIDETTVNGELTAPFQEALSAKSLLMHERLEKAKQAKQRVLVGKQMEEWANQEGLMREADVLAATTPSPSARDRKQTPFARYDRISKRRSSAVIQDISDGDPSVGVSIAAPVMPKEPAKHKSRGKSVVFANEIEVRTTPSPLVSESNRRYGASSPFMACPLDHGFVQQSITSPSSNGSLDSPHITPLPYYINSTPKDPLQQILSAIQNDPDLDDDAEPIDLLQLYARKT